MSYWKSINFISPTEQLLLEITHFWRTQGIDKCLESWLRTPAIIPFDFKLFSGFTQDFHAGSHIISAQHQIPTSPVSPDFSRVCACLPERRKVGLIFLNPGLHLTPPSSVWQVPELSQSNSNLLWLRLWSFFNPFTSLAEKPTGSEIPAQHRQEGISISQASRGLSDHSLQILQIFSANRLGHSSLCTIPYPNRSKLTSLRE